MLTLRRNLFSLIKKSFKKFKDLAALLIFYLKNSSEMFHLNQQQVHFNAQVLDTRATVKKFKEFLSDK